MACESFVEHLVGPLYFLQRMLFLRFSQISMLLSIYLYLRAGVLACRGWLFLNVLISMFLKLSFCNHFLSVIKFNGTLDYPNSLLLELFG